MITGNGTPDSPYVVTTYSELVGKAKEPGVYIELVENINIEDEFGRDEPPMLTIGNNVTIDGTGCKLHGLWSRTHSAIGFGVGVSSRSTLKNFSFESFYSSGYSFMTDVNIRYGVADIDNCVFSGVCESSFLEIYSARSGENPVFNLRNSSITVRFASADDPVFITMESANNVGNLINMSHCIAGLTSSGGLTLFNQTWGYGDDKNIWNCFFKLSAAKKIRLYPSSYKYFSMSGCMFTGENQIGLDPGNATLSGVNVFNRDAFPDTSESSKFMGASAAEIVDPEYLRSIGFPI